MTGTTWKALSHALDLLRTDIRQKQHLLSFASSSRRTESHLQEIASLQNYEKELVWLVNLYRPKTPEEVREGLAKAIYMDMEIPDKPEWVHGGRSELQEIARTAADRALEDIRANAGSASR